MPVLGRFGLLVLAAGLCADLVYHATPRLTATLFGTDGVRAHLVVLVGMVLVVCGLIQQGLSAGTPHSISEKGSSHAHR